jgi:hypothetical protein
MDNIMDDIMDNIIRKLMWTEWDKSRPVHARPLTSCSFA